MKKLSALLDQIADSTDALEESVRALDSAADVGEESAAIRDVVLGRMDALRVACDEAETVTSAKYWPFPTYGDLLFGVK